MFIGFLKKYGIVFFLILGNSCNPEDTPNKVLSEAQKAELKAQKEDTETLLDSAVFEGKAISGNYDKNSDSLLLTLVFKSCEEEHNFELEYNPACAETFPPQCSSKLMHKIGTYDSTCPSLSKEISIPLKNHPYDYYILSIENSIFVPIDQRSEEQIQKDTAAQNPNDNDDISNSEDISTNEDLKALEDDLSQFSVDSLNDNFDAFNRPIIEEDPDFLNAPIYTGDITSAYYDIDSDTVVLKLQFQSCNTEHEFQLKTHDFCLENSNAQAQCTAELLHSSGYEQDCPGLVQMNVVIRPKYHPHLNYQLMINGFDPFPVEPNPERFILRQDIIVE